MGYANRLVHVDFTEELAEPGDTVWVTIRNPKHLTAGELRPRDVPMQADGVTPVNMNDATDAMYETLAKLIMSAGNETTRSAISASRVNSIISCSSSGLASTSVAI